MYSVQVDFTAFTIKDTHVNVWLQHELLKRLCHSIMSYDIGFCEMVSYAQ